MFFPKFTYQVQSYAAVLHHQIPQALQTDGKNVEHPMQQYLPQQEMKITGLSVQATSLFPSDMLKVATVVQQNMTELSETLSEKDKIMVTTKMVLNIMEQNSW
jgi:hypothetical protein